MPDAASVERPISGTAATSKKRWAPKVRTGCATCRIRRLKCDEQKPSCKRCLSTDRACGGLGYGATARPPSWAVSRQVSRPPMTLPQFDSSADYRDLVALAIRTTSRHEVCIQQGVPVVMFPGDRLSLYISHLPRRAGHNIALDSAVKCVSSAFRRLYLPSDVDRVVSLRTSRSLYSQALQNLQRALRDPQEAVSAETLCASDLLCMFEFLTEDADQSWIGLARGAAQLIKHRGPKRFTSEFEKALLLIQIPLLMSDAGYARKQNFLNQEEWMNMLSSITLKEAVWGYSRLEVSIWQIGVPSLAVLAECSAFFLNPSDEDRSVLHETLLAKVEKQQADLTQWYRFWTEKHNIPFDDKPTVLLKAYYERDYDKIMEFFGINLSLFLILNRLYVGLDGDNSYDLERQSLEIAHGIILGEQAHAKKSEATHAPIAARVSRSTVTTAADWEVAPPPAHPLATRTRKVVDPKVFGRWMELHGAPPPGTFPASPPAPPSE